MTTHADLFSIRDHHLSQYQTYLSSLSGMLVDVLMGGDTLPSPVAVHERVDLLALRQHGLFAQTLQGLREDVQRVVLAGDDSVLREFAALLANEAVSTIIDISRREAHGISRLAMEVLMGVALTAAPSRHSLLILLDDRLRLLDAQGRRWRSERFVGVTLQSTLFKAANEAALYRGQQAKHAHFRVSHSDPRKQVALITIDDYRNSITRDLLFHPNSDALVIESY